VLHVVVIRWGAHGARGFYRAFDVTPPRVVTRIVTERGSYEPTSVSDHYREVLWPA
jgi:methylthioribose-1-phosphate isomerase